MTVLNRKLLRDLLANRGVLAAVMLIIAVGISSYVAMRTAQRNLEQSQQSYYAQYRFADFWLDVKKAPLSAVERARSVPGVGELDARVVFDVLLDVADTPEPITGRLLSVPALGFDRTLNGVCLVRGSGFSDDRDAEVIISDSFARAHGLEPGDSLRLILNRKWERFIIVGTAISPEYIYMVRGEGDVIPDPQHFGILYVKQRYARELLDFQDACNQITGKLTVGGGRDVELVLADLERQLDPYGVLAATPRERQASHRFVSDEIHGLGVFALFLSTIFLLVAALILNILMKRLAERQRNIIGTMKAFGYSNRQLLAHFLSFSLVVGVIGGCIGAVLGVSIAAYMIEMYRQYFEFPHFTHHSYADIMLTGVAFSMAFAVAGTFSSVRRVMRLPPAVAMRPRPPERGGTVFVEKIPLLWRHLSFRSHIALRALIRNRFRTAATVLATALSCGLVINSLGALDSMFYLVEYQFKEVAHSDVNIGLRDARTVSALYEAETLPGVDYAEPVLGLTFDVRNGRRMRRVSITGLSNTHRLTTPMQRDLSPIEVPDRGIVVARKLAELLDIKRGDVLDLRCATGDRRSARAVVAAITDSFLGLDCYANLDYLSEIVGEAHAVNAVQATVAPPRQNELYRALKALPNAQGVDIPAHSRNKIEETLVESTASLLGIVVLFAGCIAFGTMLNTSLIDIEDRIRDLATFRVLGYTPGQIAGIFVRQNAMTTTAGALLGVPLGYLMLVGMAATYNTELWRMPVVLRPKTAMISVVLMVVFMLAAQVFVYRRILRMDWVEGVKVKE